MSRGGETQGDGTGRSGTGTDDGPATRPIGTAAHTQSAIAA